MIWALMYIHVAIYNTDNKDLLNSTGNRTQYLVVNCSGKKSEKEYIHAYIHIYQSIYLKNITL